MRVIAIMAFRDFLATSHRPLDRCSHDRHRAWLLPVTCMPPLLARAGVKQINSTLSILQGRMPISWRLSWDATEAPENLMGASFG